MLELEYDNDYSDSEIEFDLDDFAADSENGTKHAESLDQRRRVLTNSGCFSEAVRDQNGQNNLAICDE